MSNPSGDSTITGLPAAATLQGTEFLVMDQVQGGIPFTVKATVNQIISQGLGSLLAGTPGQMLVLQAGTPNFAAFSNAATIIGGSINNTPIGGTTPNTGSFTTISTSGLATLNSLTITNALTVANGGTGRITLTSHGVLVGEGTSPINQTAAGTTGQMLLGVTGADPVFGNNPIITGGTIDGAVIGGVTPAAGSFTTLSATGAITTSQTNGIVGTTTNNNANAGSIGEYITATAGPTGVSNATNTNITSISLTAGDWDVGGSAYFSPTGNNTFNIAGSNSTSATLPAIPQYGQISVATSGANSSITIPQQRYSLSGTTTIFLVVQSGFSTGAVNVTGTLWARRRR